MPIDDRLTTLDALWSVWAKHAQAMTDEQWRQPTRLGDWDVRSLCAHACPDPKLGQWLWPGLLGCGLVFVEPPAEDESASDLADGDGWRDHVRDVIGGRAAPRLGLGGYARRCGARRSRSGCDADACRR
jgi:hypothetical protein